MQTEIIFAGFGGQGILFAGKVLTYAAMDAGQNVTWLPSYGPEMRGGTANVTVVISDQEIGSPVVQRPQIAVVFNIPSMEKYEPLVRSDGLLVYNSSLIDTATHRPDITYLPVPANEIAERLGQVTVANMVALGALAAATGILPLETLSQTLKKHLPPDKQSLLASNRQALREGAALVESVVI